MFLEKWTAVKKPIVQGFEDDDAALVAQNIVQIEEQLPFVHGQTVIDYPSNPADIPRKVKFAYRCSMNDGSSKVFLLRYFQMSSRGRGTFHRPFIMFTIGLPHTMVVSIHIITSLI